MNTMYSRMAGEREYILGLPGGRQLAYAHNGPPASRTIVIFFSGLMSVGTAPDVPASCRALDVHWIAPTLPGMGRSSTRDSSVQYHISLARDITALLEHFYPTDEYDSIFLGGASYGTVQAQMLYGAPYHNFPAGKKISGCVLLDGFSPAKYNANYAKSFSWYNWFSLGPPSQLPFRPAQRVFKSLTASMFETLEGAKGFFQETLTSKLSQHEKGQLAQWLHKTNRTEDEWLETMANNSMRSAENWDGFMEISDVIHSDWGFEPAALDDDHASKPILVVGSRSDWISGSNNVWIAQNYKSAKPKVVPGGQFSTMYYQDEIWQELLQMAGDK